MKAILKVKKYCEFQEEIEVTKKQLERIMNGNYSFDLDVLMMMVDEYGDCDFEFTISCGKVNDYVFERR